MKIKTLLEGLARGSYYFWKGFGSLSLYPYMNHNILTDREAFQKDAEALRGDWIKAGKDLEKVMQEERK